MNGTATQRSFAAAVWDSASTETAFGDATARSRRSYSIHGFWVQIAYAAIDAGMVCLTAWLVFWMEVHLFQPLGVQHQIPEASIGTYFGFCVLYAALIVLGCASQDLYCTPRDRSVRDETLMVTKAVALATALLTLFLFTSRYTLLSAWVLISAGALNVITLAGWRYWKRRLILRRILHGIGVSRVLIVGTGRTGRALARWLEENRQLGYSVCGFLDDASPNGDRQVLGTIRDLRAITRQHFVDELFITIPRERDLVKDLFFEARHLRLNLHVVPDLYDGLAWQAAFHTIGGFPVLNLHWEPIPALGLAFKRVMDVLLSSVGLIIALPILAAATLWIRLDSPGPILYSAQRVGRKGKRFRCYKLRTMVDRADAQKEELRKVNERDGPVFKVANDPRITRSGRRLRKFSIDELPQLFNVLRGDMSLVGPRPHPIDDFEQYSIEHLRRLDVKPGVTGLWQVTARRDPSFETNMMLDLRYIENWSLCMDLSILARTIPAVLRADGY
jgi:exopolysaccharide biosynthesis polyprenyl glycosylphosphotransferase